MNSFNPVGARVLIFGGTGSLGQALIRRLAGDNEVILYSRDEAKHWTLRNEYAAAGLTTMVGDVRDFGRVTEALVTVRPNIVIIASALKQVDTCELSPFESIQTNTLGVKNVVDSVIRNAPILPGLHTVLLVSTDKACAPVNVYGMCKGLAERIVTGTRSDHVKFVATRYGNVLDSRGSILPLFRHQSEKGDAITLTHPDMTRFVMTLDESVDLILTAIHRGKSGDIWIPKLRAMKIIDLARHYSEQSGKPLRIIGLRPGEKIHESLVCPAESTRAVDIGSHYILKSMSATLDAQTPKPFEYSSADGVLPPKELIEYLSSMGFLSRPTSEFLGLAINEIRTSPM